MLGKPEAGALAQPGVGLGGGPEEVGTSAHLGQRRRKTPDLSEDDVTTVAVSVREMAETMKWNVIGSCCSHSC